MGSEVVMAIYPYRKIIISVPPEPLKEFEPKLIQIRTGDKMIRFSRSQSTVRVVFVRRRGGQFVRTVRFFHGMGSLGWSWVQIVLR